MLKPGPEGLICEIVTFTFPVLLIAMACVLLLPTLTLLKFVLAGFAVSCASGVAAPVPVRAKIFVELKVLINDTLPLAGPEVVGAKITVNEVLAPAANVSGRLSPLTV